MLKVPILFLRLGSQLLFSKRTAFLMPTFVFFLGTTSQVEGWITVH